MKEEEETGKNTFRYTYRMCVHVRVWLVKEAEETRKKYASLIARVASYYFISHYLICMRVLCFRFRFRFRFRFTLCDSWKRKQRAVIKEKHQASVRERDFILCERTLLFGCTYHACFIEEEEKRKEREIKLYTYAHSYVHICQHLRE